MPNSSLCRQYVNDLLCTIWSEKVTFLFSRQLNRQVLALKCHYLWKSIAFLVPWRFVIVRVFIGHVVHVFWLVVFKRGATLLTHEHFGAPFTEAKFVNNAMDTWLVSLQWATLCEWLVTSVTFKGLYTSVCSYVTLQVKSVIKAFLTIGAWVALVKWMGFQMTVKEAPKWKRAITDLTSVVMGWVKGFFGLRWAYLRFVSHASEVTCNSQVIWQCPKPRWTGAGYSRELGMNVRCFSFLVK